MHLLATCEKVVAAMSYAHHSATRMVAWSLGLAGAIYAFSGEVARLFRVILARAALDSQGLADAGDPWGADSESTCNSVGTTPSYWWSSV